MLATSATVLLAMLTAVAGPPSLTIPPTAEIKRDTFGTINATGEFKFLKWSLPKQLQSVECDKEVTKTLKFVGPPGRYVIRAVASNEDGITDIQECLVVIGDGKVEPLPNPADPDVPSTEKYDGVHLVIVEEQKLRTVEVVKVIDKLPDWRKLKGVLSVAVYDVPADRRNLDSRIEGYIKLGESVNNKDWTKPVILTLSPTGLVLSKEELTKFSPDTLKKYLK